MLKFFCFLTGDDFIMVSKDTPQSKSKVTMLGSALLVPVMIWICVGYLLTNSTLQKSKSISLVTALFCGLLIFIIERVIIMSKTTSTIKWFRMIMGLSVAFIGALAMDEIVFEEDINYQLNINKEQAINVAKAKAKTDFDTLHPVNQQQQLLFNAVTAHNTAERAVIAEVDGRGSGRSGLGNITALKLNKAAERKTDLQRIQANIDSLTSQKERFIEAAAQKAEKNYKDGLLVRIKALFQLVTTDWAMLVIYLVFTIVMFCMEFLVILVKTSSPESNYERRVKMIEEIGKKRMEILATGTSPLLDAGSVLPNALNARKTIEKNSRLYI